jgi:hypothetical protein
MIFESKKFSELSAEELYEKRPPLTRLGMMACE